MSTRISPLRIQNPGAVHCYQTKSTVYYQPKPPLFFIMVRFNFKLILVCLTFIVLCVTILLWTKCQSVDDAWSTVGSAVLIPQRLIDARKMHEIECNINKEYTISCRKEGDEIYVPFSFLHRYFEVYGKTNSGLSPTHNIASPDAFSSSSGSLSSHAHPPRFEWSHSYGRIYRPKTKYDPRGVFMHFENYNVEVRERVKCISATDGVPVSIQWEQQGYYYPTQIAQFGLSHYSKNLTNTGAIRVIIEDVDHTTAKWTFYANASASFNHVLNRNDISATELVNKRNNGLLLRTYDNQTNNKYLTFDTYGQITLHLSEHARYEQILDFFVMMVDVNMGANASLSVVLRHSEHKEQFVIHYVKTNVLIYAQDDHNIVYGLGTTSGWQQLTRDLTIDLQKGLTLVENNKLGAGGKRAGPPNSNNLKITKSNTKIVQLMLHGQGMLDNLTFCSNEHVSHFYNSAEWFVRHQDPATGGWPNPVKRKLAKGFNDLESGWYSAMGQGHAISLLSRAYYHSNNIKYLRSAIAGLRPFRIPSWQGGVVSTFLGKYAWYEEYPTQPASFVLNGFIYSLLGLYDLKTIARDELSRQTFGKSYKNRAMRRAKDKHIGDKVRKHAKEVEFDAVVSRSGKSRSETGKRSLSSSSDRVVKDRAAISMAAKEANLLYEQGMTTLKGMLLLFDMGSGTTYDLRHFTLGVAPNLARWDYHATHVNQLLILATLDNSSVIHNTVDRWYGYMFGKRAAHN